MSITLFFFYVLLLKNVAAFIINIGLNPIKLAAAQQQYGNRGEKHIVEECSAYYYQQLFLKYFEKTKFLNSSLLFQVTNCEKTL